MSPGNDLGRKFWASLSGFLARRFVGASPLIVFAVGFALGWVAAPSQHSFESHSWFSGFFGTSAQVIATLFVGYALGARVYLASVGVATLTLVLVGASEVAAVAALSPSLPAWMYAPLMGITIGGGFGALLAALLSAARVLSKEKSDREVKGVEGMRGGAS
jgi:small basic protein